MATNNLEIYRGGSSFGSFDIDERTAYQHKQNAEHKVTAVIVVPSSQAVDFQQGDYIVHDGMRFEINQPVSATKTNQRTIEYEVNFESPVYRLYNLSFIHQGEADFTYLGTLNDYATLIINNMNREDSGWTLGVIDSTEPLYMSFLGGDEGYSCRTALTAICDRFGMEFWVSGDGKILNISKTAGKDTNYDFEVGRSLGLYSLTRRPPDNLQLVNRIRPKGSTRNIDFTYRGGARRLKIASDYVETPLEPNELRREGTFIFEDIYPHRNGTIDSVAGDSLSFVDSALFDINGQKIDGEQAMIVMQSGLLTGEQFEIAGYNHATNTVTINPVTLSNGEIIPNNITKIQAGDTYTITGIIMPQLYIDQAEEELRVRALELLSQPKNPIYDLEIDEKYVRDNIIVLNTGDRINVRDTEMGIDANIRVTSLEYPLVRPEQITCEISDVIPYSVTERIIIENSKTEQIVREVNVTSAEQARRNMLNLRTLQEDIYDPDGYLDPTNIRPLSIETAMLSVGVKSQNFGLNNVVIDANTGGDPNLLTITAGQLIHYEVQIEGVGYTWEIPSKSFTLDPLKKYWLFARCSRITLNGTWEVSETPILSEDPTYPNAWQFLVGLVYQVNAGRRDLALTNGMTMIVGDTITTGRIKSLDGSSYFDLTQNKFKLGGATSGIDWNVTRPGQLTTIGGIVQSRSGAFDYTSVNRGDYNASTSYFRGDVVKYDGSWYKYINPSVENVSGILPTNATYWRLEAQKGDAGPAGAPGQRGPSPTYQGVYSPSTTYYGTSDRVDIVKYLGVYYMANPSAGAFSGQLPTNPAYWNYFGASFESVATALLFAEMAVIENATVRYLETAPSGKRTIINNPRVLRSSGVTQYENNIKIVNASNQDLLEIDDDSAQAQELFTITFSSNVPAANVRNWDQNWSAYNGSFLSTTYAGGGSPLWASGNFTDGFPRKFTNVINQVGGNYVYYFFYEEQGLIVHGNDAEGIFPKTTFGKNVAYMRNSFINGSMGTGFSRYVNGGNIDTDFNSDDADIIVPNNSPGFSVTLPAWVISGVVQQVNLSRSPFGREIRIINESSVNSLTINSQSGNIIRRHGADVSSFALLANKTAIIKVTSTGSPIQLGFYRWQVIAIMDN